MARRSRLSLTLGARWEYNQLPQPRCPKTGTIHSMGNKSYARFSGGSISNLFKNNAVYQSSMSLSSTQPAQLAAGPVVPNVLAAPPPGASVASTYIQFAAPNLKTPYSEQGNNRPAAPGRARPFGQCLLHLEPWRATLRASRPELLAALCTGNEPNLAA